jgi:hypothetical protein
MNRWLLGAFAAVSISVLLIANSQSTAPHAPPPPSASATVVQTPSRNTPDNPRYRAFKTQNIWNLLILDSRTGRLWQAQYSNSTPPQRGTWPIQELAFASETGSNGRFTLTLTENMWNALLLDSETGAAWQCQFSIDGPEKGFCVPILIDR